MNLSTFWLLIALVAMGGWSVLHYKLFFARRNRRWQTNPRVLAFVLVMDFYLLIAAVVLLYYPFV